MLHRRPVLRCVVFGILGAVPGVLFAINVSRTAGSALLIAGATIGVVLALPRSVPLSLRRTVRLLVAMIVARNLPVPRDRMLKWVDEGAATPQSDPLADWFLARHVQHRRGRLVLAATLAGVLAGIAIAAHDIRRRDDAAATIALPLPGSRNSIYSDAAVFIMACGIWCGSIGGVFASAAYRRPVVFSGSLAALLIGAIEIGADHSPNRGSISLVLAFVTVACGLALLCAGLLALESKDSSSDSESQL